MFFYFRFQIEKKGSNESNVFVFLFIFLGEKQTRIDRNVIQMEKDLISFREIDFVFNGERTNKSMKTALF